MQGYDAPAHTPSILELCGIPYVGHRPLLAVTLDNKHIFKRECAGLGLPTLPFVVWESVAGSFAPDRTGRFAATFGDYPGPFVIKPVSGRASQHVQVVSDRAALPDALEQVYGHTRNLVQIEPFIDGPEYCVSVSGALVVRAGRLERRDRRFFVLCAVLGVVINQELFIHGLARTTATNAVVLGSTIPVFTALFAIALGYESASRTRLVGIALAFVGCVVLVGPDELSLKSSHLLGSVMVLANAASYGMYLAIARKVAGRYDPFAIVAILFLVGVPLVAPLGVHAWSQAGPLTGATIGFLAFLILVPTVGAYSLVQIALQHAESSLVASYIYLQPIFTTVAAAFLLDERPGPTAAAAAIVLGGVW
ncbi:MAG: EamA family transporter, partial [Rhodospirillaceae bacterium]|nr:EamA family transporter [Rhodospirillaceae bacterium]